MISKTDIEKIKKRQKPFFDLIDEIGNLHSQMEKVYELLGSVIEHLKTFLCSEEILTEYDPYYVRNKFALKRRSSIKTIKSSIYSTMKKIKKHFKKRPHSVSKEKNKENNKEDKKKENEDTKENENTNFYIFDCEEEKIVLIFKRYNKLFQEFYNTKTNKFEINKIPVIYDNIKYDIIHNKSILSKEGYKLFNIVNKLANFLMPLEYGINIEEKFNIGIKLIKPLLLKIKNDLLWMNDIPKSEKENEDILQENKYNDINPSDQNVKTRFYFTSQSHLYALFNTIIYGLNSFLVDDQKVINPIWKIFDLDYCSHIVFRLFENFKVKKNDKKRYRIEIIISSGANKDPKLSDNDHFLSVNPWIVVNEHLTLDDLNKYFNVVLQ